MDTICSFSYTEKGKQQNVPLKGESGDRVGMSVTDNKSADYNIIQLSHLLWSDATVMRAFLSFFPQDIIKRVSHHDALLSYLLKSVRKTSWITKWKQVNSATHAHVMPTVRKQAESDSSEKEK